MITLITILFLILIQFFRKTLNLAINYPKINKLYLVAIYFYCGVGISKLFLLVNLKINNDIRNEKK